ncbi:MAG: TolC family protein, partial [Planctomycetes bacterium]|nr:TolC family protein [Planctomycetota bacterium]
SRRSALYLVACLVTVPVIVGIGKETTGVYCPRQIERYGGSHPYVRVFEANPPSLAGAKRGHCFPAGHPSGGFALMGLFFVAARTRRKWAGLGLGIACGSVMGAYQMLKGAHYLSHVVTTALLAWLIVLLLERAFSVRKSLAVPLLVLAFAVALPSCASTTSDRDREWVGDQITERVGVDLDLDARISVCPGWVHTEDGLDADEAVGIALANQPEFEAALAELDVSRARLLQSGMLKNPVLSLLFPLGPKQLESTLTAAIDPIWLQPRRVQVARLDLETLAETLVEAGLGLARDTRLAHAAVLVEKERLAANTHLAALWARQSDLVGRQIAAGEVPRSSRHEVDAQLSAARLASLESQTRLRLALVGLRERMGVAMPIEPGNVVSKPPWPSPPTNIDDLVALALASRPEVRAAELRLEAAAERAKLSGEEFLAVSLIADANAKGSQGFEAGPGLLLELPLFDQGQGRRATADAGLSAAVAQCRATRHRIREGVIRAATALKSSQELADASAAGPLALALGLREDVTRLRAAGDATALDEVQAELAVARAKLVQVDREAAVDQAAIALAFALGRSWSP